MESEKEINLKILKTTMIIQEQHPELSKYLDEMPDTIPNTKDPELNNKILKAYSDALTSLLESYVHEHTKVVPE